VAPRDIVGLPGVIAMEVGSAIPFSPPHGFKDNGKEEDEFSDTKLDD
jgi:hypothetical protein